MRKLISDLFITLFMWILFVVAMTTLFVIFPLLLILSILAKDKQLFFQTILHSYLKFFIGLGRRSIPGLTLNIDNLEKRKNVSSSIILCNHTSYLDGLLLFSFNRKQIAIMKESIFKIPVIGWLVYLAGNIPSSINKQIHMLTLKRINGLTSYFENGGNLLIFPEGKRSQDGKLNPFKLGVFNLIKRCQVSVELLLLNNMDNLFGRNMILFNTCVDNDIEVITIAHFEPKDIDSLSAKELRNEIYQLYFEATKSMGEEKV